MPIYLDHHATTPCDPRVAAAMRPWLEGRVGNAHSAHRHGWAAAEAVEAAREAVAGLIGGRAQDIVFTSGATEANNLALYGLDPARLVVSAVEHDSVIEPARAAGCPLTILPVDAEGRVDPARLAGSLEAGPALVSIQAANHEIGTLQPLSELAGIAHARGAVLHADAAQAAGKVPLDVTAIGCDLMSLSAHKLHGPQGIGALWLRPGLRLRPLLHGGGQERGLRPGTLPVALCAGFGVAADLAMAEMAVEARRLAALRDRLLGRLRDRVPRLMVNGSMQHRLPGNLNISVEGVNAEAVLTALSDRLSASTGSACANAAQRPSPVLAAIGCGVERIFGAFRFGLGRFTTAVDIDEAADLLADQLRR